jgi:S1-C subfamily serine protease
MEILRDGKPKTLTFTAKAMPEKYGLAERPTRQGREEQEAKANSFKADELGMEVSELTPQEAETRGFKGYAGVLITGVDQDGVAYEKGFREGDLIRKIGKTEVKDLKSFQEALKTESLKDGVMVQIRTQRGNDFKVLKTT